MRVRNARFGRSFRHFGDDSGGTDLSTTSSSDLGAGWLTGQTDTSGAGDMLDTGTLQSPEAGIGADTTLQNTDQGSVLFDNTAGSTPTTDAGSALWGGQSTSGGSGVAAGIGSALSSIFAPPKTAAGVSAATVIPGVSNNVLLIGGGLLLAILLVRK